MAVAPELIFSRPVSSCSLAARVLGLRVRRGAGLIAGRPAVPHAARVLGLCDWRGGNTKGRDRLGLRKVGLNSYVRCK
jgi:hypothetical protein